MMRLEISNNLMPQNSRSSGPPKNDAKTLYSTLHPLFTVVFATAAVLAFVLLRNSSFNFHCYTQREATPTQKSARKCAATSRDILRERLESAFTLANSFAESPDSQAPCQRGSLATCGRRPSRLLCGRCPKNHTVRCNI